MSQQAPPEYRKIIIHFKDGREPLVVENATHGINVNEIGATVMLQEKEGDKRLFAIPFVPNTDIQYTELHPAVIERPSLVVS